MKLELTTPHFHVCAACQLNSVTATTRCCRGDNDDDDDSAISAVSKMGRWKEALSMMKQMTKDGVAFDVYTYSGAITACGKGGKADKAVELLDEMVDEHGETLLPIHTLICLFDCLFVFLLFPSCLLFSRFFSGSLPSLFVTQTRDYIAGTPPPPTPLRCVYCSDAMAISC